jgi:DNA invertase Pin-like site-specific DNA recombinase
LILNSAYIFYRIGIDNEGEQAQTRIMVKAFSYLRVSGKGQVSGDGFPRQRAAIKAHAKANGFTIVREFADEGVSGAIETTDRAAFAEMVATLHSNGVRTVIVEKLDRLARDLMVQESALSYFSQHGFTIVSVCEPDLMANDPSRTAFRQMMGVFSQYDKSMIVLKLKGARMRKKAKEGFCEGRKPFGHYEGEEEILGRLKTLRAEGLGFDRIAAKLNEEGVPTRTGKPWHGVVVNRILTGKKRS